MAKVNVAAADNIRVRASSIEENRAILREIQAKKEVDARKPDELNVLFDGINAECASRSLKEKKKALALTSADKIENTAKPVHYGPLPGYPPGKWWGIRMDCSRDCVHEPFNENIHDGPYGAVSICTSHLSTHNDVDLGNVLTYTSREYNAANKTKDSLILSYKNRVPIRLVRSYCLGNKYAPKTGYRYDGLYTVVRHWIGVSADATRHHKFVLTRVINQEPPPWVDRKANFKTSRLKKSSRLTRSQQQQQQQHSNTSAPECKAIKFIYNKVEKKSKPASVSAIVSRQVFDKCTSSSPDNSFRLALGSDSTKPSLCTSSCSAKLCSTRLSVRTSLYDSHQEAKKAPVCKIFKPNQFVQLSQAPCKESELVASETRSTPQAEDKAPIKKVTWADACNAGIARMDNKSVAVAGNGFQYSAPASASEGFSPKSCRKSRVAKFNNSADCCPSSKMAKHTSAASADRTGGQSHSSSESEKTSESSSIDSLAPDELVSVIVKEKYHPMAKLLIGNMIGLENQEAAIVTAYNALTRVNQEDSKQSKENKMRSKFSIKSPAKKNGILTRKTRREIANLTIDAKFEARSSRSRGLGTSNMRILKSDSARRKLLNARRIPSRNKGIQTSRESSSKRLAARDAKVPETVAQAPKMVTVWTQCSLLAAPTVDRCQQTDEACSACTKEEPMETVDLDNAKYRRSSPTCSDARRAASRYKGTGGSIGDYARSAFAAVSADSNDGIARLRSIGFRPIGGDSPVQDVESGDESSRPDVDQEYKKYTSEENDVVGYMDEQLHFEDIEEEEEQRQPEQDEQMSIEEDDMTLQADRTSSILPQPIETLTEHDFDKPWHGWRKISINGQTYWTGC